LSDDERRFVNNPFARALHPEPSRSLFAKLALAVVSLVGALIMAAALLLPIVFVPGLLRGYHDGRWGMVAAGVLIVAVYVMIAASVVRRLLARGATANQPRSRS
jgi:hypothetical protein